MPAEVATTQDLMLAERTLYESIAALNERVTALENVEPPIDPPIDPPSTDDLVLKEIGGYRIALEFARGAIAINHVERKLYVAGHSQRNEVAEFALPPHGTGTDISQWPRLDPIRIIPGWWPEAEGQICGMIFDDGDLWVCPKLFYDMRPPPVTKMYSRGGEVVTINVPRQQYAGFVKAANGFELGCGGYESGQGSASGPTLATLSGVELIQHPWGIDNWDDREERAPNYWPSDGKDSWVCIAPRNGVGRWACDRVYGGGIRLPSGVYYWPYMGTGDLNYARQSTTFGDPLLDTTYQYRYSSPGYKLEGWKELAGPGLMMSGMKADTNEVAKVVSHVSKMGWTDTKPTIGAIHGQDISPDGKHIYLAEGYAWTSGMWKADPVLRIYTHGD